MNRRLDMGIRSFFHASVASTSMSLSPLDDRILGAVTMFRHPIISFLTADTVSSFLTMPTFTAFGKQVYNMALVCPATISGDRSIICSMPLSFCTVMDVMAVSAWPPRAVMVLMSRCMPVPPVLSDPVIVRIGVSPFMVQ